MSSQIYRNKTLKKNLDLSGTTIPDQINTDSLLRFLDQDAGNAYKRQWHRLERGLRLNRLKKFTQEEAERLHLSDPERDSLYSLLCKSLDKKLLNSKTAVVYDPLQEKITEIKGLVMHRNSEGTNLFQLLDKQKGVTFRRKKSTNDEQA
jgi:hypothetical protein